MDFDEGGNISTENTCSMRQHANNDNSHTNKSNILDGNISITDIENRKAIKKVTNSIKLTEVLQINSIVCHSNNWNETRHIDKRLIIPNALLIFFCIQQHLFINENEDKRTSFYIERVDRICRLLYYVFWQRISFKQIPNCFYCVLVFERMLNVVGFLFMYVYKYEFKPLRATTVKRTHRPLRVRIWVGLQVHSESAIFRR